MIKRKIILASKSERRKAILQQVGIDFEVREGQYEENMAAFRDPVKLVKFLALGKAENVAKHYKNAVVIGSDTFVVFKGQFIGKPKDKKDAKRILKMLSGKEHWIISGFAIIDTRNKKIINDFSEAKVRFKKLSDQEIDDYIQTGDPLDKAGAYGIMNKGSFLAESIQGDFYAIVGFPICKIWSALKKLKAI